MHKPPVEASRFHITEGSSNCLKLFWHKIGNCWHPGVCGWDCVKVVFFIICFLFVFFQGARHHIQRFSFPYPHTSCRWPRPGWRTPTRAAVCDSRRSSRWSRWTRSSLPLHSRRASRRSIPGLLQSTPPSPAPTRQWSCNNWFFFFLPQPGPNRCLNIIDLIGRSN